MKWQLKSTVQKTDDSEATGIQIDSNSGPSLSKGSKKGPFAQDMAQQDISDIKPFYPSEPSNERGRGRGRGGRGRGERGGRGRGKPDANQDLREKEYYPSDDVVFLEQPKYEAKKRQDEQMRGGRGKREEQIPRGSARGVRGGRGKGRGHSDHPDVQGGRLRFEDQELKHDNPPPRQIGTRGGNPRDDQRRPQTAMPR